MIQPGQCPACGAPRYPSSTWCAYCGFVFPTATTAGGWQIGRTPRPLPPELLAPTGPNPAAPTPSPQSWPAPNTWQAPPPGWQAPPPAGWTQPGSGTPPPAATTPEWPRAVWPPAPSNWKIVEAASSRPVPSAFGSRPLVAAIVSGAAVVVALAVAVAVAVVASPAAFSRATPRPTPRLVAVATATPEQATPKLPSPEPTASPLPAEPTATATSTDAPEGVVRHVNGHIEFADGTYGVGATLPPGTYRSLHATRDCYWERTVEPIPGVTESYGANYSGLFDAQTVTIRAGDDRFTSVGCGTWSSDVRAITKSRTTFEDGLYLVGVDIAPGTYTSPGYPQCSWERLSDLSGDPDDVLQDEYVGTGGKQTVQIKATDKGFLAWGCGDWTKE